MKEKDYFCKRRCPYSEKKTVEVPVADILDDCEHCGKQITVIDITTKIDPCVYCVINEYINEIRDSNVEVK